MPSDEDMVAAFDARFAPLRNPVDPTVLARTFGADEVRAYVAAKARRPTDFSYPYRDVLRGFPRDWWEEAIVTLLDGPVEGGATSFVEAAFEIGQDLFVPRPELVIRWLLDRAEVFAFLQAHGGREGLERVVRDPASADRWRAAAWLLLLEEGTAPVVHRAISDGDERTRWIADDALEDVGWTFEDDGLRRLWPKRVRHLVFPAGYVERTSEHPTWRPARSALEPGEHAFGGRVGALHHVMTLDPAPRDLGLSVPRLVLAIDLDTAYEEGAEQYFRHHADGSVEDPGHEGQVPPFARTKVVLARTRPEHALQGWRHGENLFRLGGLPVFVQGPLYVQCSSCGRKMTHLLSLDSGLALQGPAPNGVDRWDWGSGGVANAFWCDDCRVSAWTHACT